MARPFNNYGPGLKITDRSRHSRLRARRARRARHRHALGRHGRRARSATSPTPSPATTRFSSRGRPGEPYNIGIEEPEISMAELAERVVALGRELFGYAGSVVPGDERRTRTTSSTIPIARCPMIDKARERARLRPDASSRRGPRALAALVPRRTARSGAPDAESAIVGAGYVGARHRRRASPSTGTTSSASTSTRASVAAIDRGQRADPRAQGSTSSSSATLGERLAPRRTCATPCSATRSDDDRRRHAVRPRRASTSRHVAAAHARSARRSRPTTAITSSSSRARSSPAPRTTSCVPTLEERVGQARGPGLRRRR